MRRGLTEDILLYVTTRWEFIVKTPECSPWQPVRPPIGYGGTDFSCACLQAFCTESRMQLSILVRAFIPEKRYGGRTNSLDRVWFGALIVYRYAE